MNAQRILCALGFAGVLSFSACGTAPSDTAEQQDGVLSWPVPVALRLTTIKMNNQSNNQDVSVNVYVTLPGLTETRTYLGDYSPVHGGMNFNQFSCSSVHALPGADGYCTTKLPMTSTVGPTKFTGKYPAGTNSQNASVRINGTTTRFTIDSTGKSSQTCATAFMTINNIIDGDKITVCWQTTTAIPFTSPPILETVFYQAPGEESSVGLTNSNSVSTKTTWTHAQGMSFNMNFAAGKIGENLSIQGGQTFSSSTSVTAGSSTGYALPSTTMFPDPNNNQYIIVVGANASWLNLNDGSAPSATVDLSSGFVEALTLGQLKGLAQTPQDLSTIPVGDQATIVKYIIPSVAQQFVAQDPFASGNPIAQTVANNPKRFQPATPARLTLQRRTCPTCGDLSTTETQVKGSGTDMTVGQSTGDTFSFGIVGIGFGANETDTMTETYSDTNMSTATITLKTHSLCIEGGVDLYMDKALGTIVPVPHLEDSCNAPTNTCPNNEPATMHVLTPGQSLSAGQTMTSCNGLWTLAFQPDGTLAEKYVDGSIVTTFYPPGAATATMQSNGDFVLTDANGNFLGDSGTSSSSGAYFILQDDGFLAIYNPLGNPAGGTGGALPAIWTLGPGG